MENRCKNPCVPTKNITVYIKSVIWQKIDLTLLQTCTNDLINVNTVSKVTKIRNTVKTMDWKWNKNRIL